MARNNIFKIDIEIRLRDLDRRGHVNNAVFFTYFENARLKFYHSVFHNGKLPEISFILVHTGCDYFKPVTLTNHLELLVWVKKIGCKSFSFNYNLVDSFDTSVIYAAGESVQVCFDYQKNISIPIPKEIKTQLALYLFYE